MHSFAEQGGVVVGIVQAHHVQMIDIAPFQQVLDVIDGFRVVCHCVVCWNINNIYFWQNEDQDQRHVSLSVVYRFNNYSKKYKGQSAADDVLNRL